MPAPPIVRGLLDPHPDVDVVAGYAQWTVLSVADPLALDHLVAGVRTVLERHDALRLRVTAAEDQPVELVVRTRDAVSAAQVVSEVRDVPADEIDDRVEALAEQLAGSLDPLCG